MTPLAQSFIVLALCVSVVHAEPPRLDRHGDPLPDGAQVRLGSARLRHSSSISCVLFSPDGRTLFSAASRDIARCWDADTGAPAKFPGVALPHARSFAISPDGKTLAVGYNIHVVLRDLATGRDLRTLPDVGLSSDALRFTPDGKSLITSGDLVDALDRSMVLISDVATGAERFGILEDRRGTIFFDLSPDGKFVATAQREGVRLWDIEKQTEIRRLTTASRPLKLCFAPDGKTLVSAERSVLQFWDVATWTEKNAVGRSDFTGALAYSPDGALIATAHDNELVLRDAATGDEVRRLGGQLGEVNSVAFSPDGKTLAAGGTDCVVRAWDVTTGRQKLGAHEPVGQVLASRFTHDGQQVVIITADWCVRVWDARTGALVRRMHHDDPRTNRYLLETAAVSLDGKTAAISSELDGMIYLWDASTGKEMRYLKPDAHIARALAFTPDGKELLSAGAGHDDKTTWRTEARVLQWNVATGRVEREYRDLGPAAVFYSLSLTCDGSLLAVAGNDRVCRFFDVASGQLRGAVSDGRAFDGPTVLSPDGRVLAVCNRSILELWEVASARPFLLRLPETNEVPSHLTFSPDGRKLAWAYQRGVRITDVLTLETTGIELEGLRISCMAFSPDGRRLLTAEENGTALIWDTERFKAVDVKPREVDPFERFYPRELDPLASTDVEQARRGIDDMVAMQDLLVIFLRDRSRPVPSVDSATIRRLIHDLDSDDFETRDRASVELARVVEAAEPELRTAAKESPSAEVRRQAALLLRSLEEWQYPMSGGALRTVRTIEVLERIGTPEARKLLRDLAKGAPGARQTREAAAALKRLEGT
jgi:WD40 repeat protein